MDFDNGTWLLLSMGGGVVFLLALGGGVVLACNNVVEVGVVIFNVAIEGYILHTNCLPV